MLAERHADDAEPEPRVTAEEWLAAHRAALADDERTRPVTEDDGDAVDEVDTVDEVDGCGADARRRRVETALADAVEPDLREIAAAEPRQTREDETRVPYAHEMVDSTKRARRVLHEINAREAYDQQAEQDELGRWHDDDQNSDRWDTTDGDDLDNVDDWADDYPSAR